MLSPHPDPQVEARLLAMQRYMRWLESKDGKLPPELEEAALVQGIDFLQMAALMDDVAAALSAFIITTRKTTFPEDSRT